MGLRHEIAAFLRTFKGCAMVGRLTIKSREKNRQGLLDLGFTAERRREVLWGLEPEDYLAGPKRDHSDATKEVWEFGKAVEGTEIYIKLRVVEDPGRRGVHHALVWSFHPAEFPLKYPLKGGGS